MNPKRPPLQQQLRREAAVANAQQNRPTQARYSRPSPAEEQRIRRESRAILEAFKAQVEGLDDEQVRELKSAAPRVEQVRALEDRQP